MKPRNPAATRPASVKAYTLLLAAGALFMALLGWSASAYYVPAAYLLLQAILLWQARAYAFFRWTMIINQISGLALILVLWLGDGLGNAKLDISGAMLLLNLLFGGPLMAILAVSMLPAMRRQKALHQWFCPTAA